MEPTIIPILNNENAITIDYNLWGSYIAQDLLKNVPSSTFVLITDTNLYGLYVPFFEKIFNNVASSMRAESRLLTYTIPPGETSKSRATKAEVEDWMLSEERDPPLDVSTVYMIDRDSNKRKMLTFSRPNQCFLLWAEGLLVI